MRLGSTFAGRRATAGPPLLARRSSWPRHVAAALLERTRDLRAVDHFGDLETVVRHGALGLRLADAQRCQQLVLPGTIEGRVRPERDLWRQMKVLKRTHHVDGLKEIGHGVREGAGPCRYIAEP